jgi:hypothetical protein
VNELVFSSVLTKCVKVAGLNATTPFKFSRHVLRTSVQWAFLFNFCYENLAVFIGFETRNTYLLVSKSEILLFLLAPTICFQNLKTYIMHSDA